MSVPKQIQIGRVRKLHGIKGMLRIALDLDLIDGFPPYLLIGKQKPLPYFVESVSEDGKGNFLIKLEDIDDRNEAEKLSGAEIFIKESDLKDFFLEPENTLPQIIGFKLIDQDSRVIGEMLGYEEMPQQTLIIAENEGREILIPFLSDTVIEIDAGSKTAKLNLPEGLLDLYL